MSRNPARHLDKAAESIRAFNHTSRTVVKDWQYPGDAYSALGNLSYLAGMLEQAIEQSIVPATHAHKEGRLRIDGNGDPNAKIDELIAARNDATRAAEALTAAIQRMHNATGPMGMDIAGMPDDEDDD